MAIFKILKGSSSRISTTVTPFTEGYAYFTPDTNGFYIDATTDGGVQTRFHVNSTNVTALSLTLPSNGWSNGSQTITATGVSSTSDGMIGLPESVTSAQLTAAQDAALRLTAQGTNSITVTATDTVPTIDIPILLLIFN